MINSNAAKSLNTQGISKSEDLEIKRKWMNVNRQFLNDMQRLERSLGGMDQRQKCVASEWIGKLKTNPPNLDEAVARNKILTFLLNCMGPTLLIKKPLSTPPVLHRFTNISHSMVSSYKYYICIKTIWRIYNLNCSQRGIPNTMMQVSF